MVDVRTSPSGPLLETGEIEGLVNVGDGAQSFKGISGGVAEIRSLTFDGFPLTQDLNEIDFGINNVVHLGKVPWMYQTLDDAITAINSSPKGPPTSTNRGMVLVWPGKYISTAPVTIPQYCGVIGTSKGLCQFQNDVTNIFTLSNNTFLENFLIEGSPTEGIYAIEGNNATGWHIRHVDMLAQGGTARQLFFRQTGATWRTGFIEHCIIDGFQLTHFQIRLQNTSGIVRDCDVHLNDVFSDSLHLTDVYGGNVLVEDCSNIVIRCSLFRQFSTAGGSNGVRLERDGASGTTNVIIAQSFSEGQVAVFGTASTNYFLLNTDAIGALTSGSRTLRNSSVV